MISSNKKGIWLCQVQARQKKDFAWGLKFVMSLAGCWAITVLLRQMTGIKDLEGTLAMGATGMVVCAIHLLLNRIRQESWFYPGVLTGCLLLTLILRAEMLEGFRLMFNRLSLTYTSGTGWVMPMLSGGETVPNPVVSVSVAAILLGCGAACLCCGTENHSGWIVSVILTGGLLSGMILLRREMDGIGLAYLLTVSLLMILNGAGKDSAGSGVMVLRWIACMIAGLALLAVVMTPGIQRTCETLSRSIHNRIHRNSYETEWNPLPEGDFTDYELRERDPQTMLTVTLEHPQALYLRGFVGCSFEENQWSPMDNEILAKNRDLLYWLNQKEFHPAAQFSAAAALQNRQRSQVTVQNVKACSQYMYVPYGIFADSCSRYLPAEDLRTDSVYAQGQRSYMYSIVAGGTEEIGDILTRLQSGTEEKLLAFRRAESAYRAFADAHYRQVPQEARELLQERWDSCARGYGTVGELTNQQAQECALYFLEQCFPEDGAETEDILPLDVAKGTPYQEATVATLTLRYYGVPARYAEGYIITAEMAVTAGENGTINVTDANAGAWVEVYQDGIGWIPMDLTPGMGQTIREEPYSSVRSDDAEQKQGVKTEEKEKEEETDRPDGGTLVRLKRILNLGLLLLPLLILVLLLLVIFRRRYILKCQKQRFRSESCRDAVGWIFRDAACLLAKMGLDRGNGSMEALCPMAAERFGSEYASWLQLMITLNGRAVFSSREMEESQREEMLRFFEATLAYLKETSNWIKKLWMKWVLCLY